MDSAAISGRRRWATVVGTLVAGLLLALLGPAGGQAHAAACSGHKARGLSFSTGTVQIYRKSGFVCVTAHAERPGKRRHMSVSVQARGHRAVKNEGRFTRYAGPVNVHAGKRCVRIKATVGRASVNSGWILC
ncbi:hypothetical protein DSC45_06335 [Streptomyces sp. YIM 130001]|uniref:hypothetical protein n=1 Tax=Streptomyces sp. YIM 130001 TaxID=2259644 RepID=UPI000E65E20E|nr:hypothetical protein [Streptomyces sp. YIM 130001]RII19613.1 hypothetical protein DSC45_06335 [Streptomyces sp. YIM 130001]